MKWEPMRVALVIPVGTIGRMAIFAGWCGDFRGMGMGHVSGWSP